MSELQNRDAPSLNEGQDVGKSSVHDNVIGSSQSLDAASEATKQIAGKAGSEIKGRLFESKLLTLSMVRAIIAGYEFELASNNEDIGGKFDDLILRYQVQDDTPEGKHWRYRFLQAKHKVDKTALQIKASYLMSTNYKDKDNEVKDYSLIKYFKSYDKMKARGDDIEDCIICTNINFDYTDIEGIQLKPVDTSEEKILNFRVNNRPSGSKSPAHYKLELSEEARTKLLESDDIRILANQFVICVTKNHPLNQEIFKAYHVALVEENVIDLGFDPIKRKTIKFHPDFINNIGTLSAGARDLHQTLSNLKDKNNLKDLAEWTFKRSKYFEKFIDAEETDKKLPQCNTITDNDNDNFIEFCDKLVFVVNSPSEDELDDIIRTDVNNYYNQSDTESEFLRISKEVLDWFKSIKTSPWLSSMDGKKILLDGVTKQSIEYRDKLMEEIGFNQNAMENMATKLKQELDSTNKVVYISTLSPKWTAAKIISTVETWSENKAISEYNYWITSPSSLLNEDERRVWENRIKLTRDSRHLVLVVDDDKSDVSNPKDIADFFPDNRNKIIFIGNGNSPGIQDEINFVDLNDAWQKTILSTGISFQGKEMTVENLLVNHTNTESRSISLNKEANKVIDSSSIREIMNHNKKTIAIPSYSSSRFEQSLYIEREVMFPLISAQLQDEEQLNQVNCSLRNELQGECKINSNGKIQWFVQDEESKKKTWKKIKGILERNKNSADNSLLSFGKISENEVVNRNNNNRVIIMGVAGTGKSTTLFNYYKQIKMEKPDCWAIRVNLVDHSKALLNLKLNSIKLDQSKAIEFLMNLPTIGVGQSPFAQSLLRHRLETGDRIILMLDGYDEIGSDCQDAVIQIVRNLEESIPIYITTRPHMADNLQIELSQLGYRLVKLNEDKQVNYLISFWMDFIWKTILGDNNLGNCDLKILKEEKSSIWENAMKISIENTENVLQSFANILVNKVSKTLNDQEKDFIGIPLQCRILAECFQSKIYDKINSSCDDNIEMDFSNLLVGQHFDLSNLYRMLIQTKRQVFRKDKIKLASTQNDIADSTVKMSIMQIETHLTKLAIKTIFQNQEHVSILWPAASVEKHRYQSDNDFQKEETMLDDLSVKFGLLDKPENQLQFLHRTYAEFLVADYIYKGFLLDERDHNKLLDNFSVRNLIANELLLDAYDGVLVFLDSMFKEMTEINKEERAHQVTQQQIRDRQQRLAHFFYESRLLKTLSKHSNITNFILDCFDETFLTYEIQSHINNFARFQFDQNNQMFNRFLGYFEYANDTELTKMINFLCDNSIYSRRTKRITPTENVKSLISFVKRQRNWITTLKNNQEKLRSIIWLFEILINDNSNHLLNEFSEFLKSIYSPDLTFIATLLKGAITIYYLKNNWEIGNISRTLDVLHHLFGLDTQINNAIRPSMSKISCLVLKHEPKTFIEFYKKYYLNEEITVDNTANNCSTWFDTWGMTFLHRAALKSDTQTVDGKLNHVMQKIERSKKPMEWERAINIIITMICATNTHVPLLYLGFITCCEKEKMCHKMLEFLKQVLSNFKRIATLHPDVNYRLYDELNPNPFTWDLMSDSGESVRHFRAANGLLNYELRGIMPKDESLRGALEHTINFNKVKTFRGILKSVKLILGQDAVVKLLEIEIFLRWKETTQPKCRKSGNGLITVFLAACEIGWFKIVVDELSIEQLNYLVFQEDNILALEYAGVDTIQRLITTDGLEKFYDYLLEKDSILEFDPSLLTHIISALDATQRSRLVEFMKNESNKLATQIYTIKTITDFIKQAPKLFNENDVKKLLFLKNDINPLYIRRLIENRIWYRKKSIGYDQKILLNNYQVWHSDNEVDEMLACMSDEIQIEFRNRFAEQESRMVDEFFFDEKMQSGQFTDQNWLPILQFYLDYGNKNQLANFIDFLTTSRSSSNTGENSCLWDFIIQKQNSIDGIATLMKEVSKKLGENAVKHLLLQDNGSGVLTLNSALMKFAGKFEFEQIYAHLSIESRDEIRNRILATPGVVDQMLDDEKDNLMNKSEFQMLSTATLAEYWIRNYFGKNSKGIAASVLDGFTILSHYFIEKLNTDILQWFIKWITTVQRLDKSTRYSIWTDYIDQSCKSMDPSTADQTIRTFVKYIKEMKHKENETWLYQLVTYDIDGMGYTVVVRAATSGNIQIFEALISQQDEIIQREIRHKTFRRLEVVKSVWNRNGPEHLIKLYLTETRDSQNKTKLISGFNMLVHYFLDVITKEQLRQFIELILSVNLFEFCHTIWGDYIGQLFQSNFDRASIQIQTIETLLKRVAIHLGETLVKKLICHQDAEGIMIIKRIDNSNSINPSISHLKIVNRMLSYLTDESRKEVLSIPHNNTLTVN